MSTIYLDISTMQYGDYIIIVLVTQVSVAMTFVNTVLKNGALQQVRLEGASSAHCAVRLPLHLEFNLLVSTPVTELT
jgi:hypothetical protein